MEIREWVLYGAKIILCVLAVFLVFAFISGSVRLISSMIVEVAEQQTADTQKWVKESQCTLEESYFGLVFKWHCEDGSSYWRGP